MLIKWIRCSVTEPEAFDNGQRAWTGLRELPGFLGQGGGWSRHEPSLAHVFGWWADRSAYETFMAETHDCIAATQAGTYRAIEVHLFEFRMHIGEHFPADWTGASLLRLAHWHAKATCQEHFIGAWAETWNPEMTRAPGLHCGVLAQRGGAQRGGAQRGGAQRGGAEFLVLSLWKSATDHDRYVNEYLPDPRNPRKRSGTAGNPDRIAGDLVDLESAWTVPARHRHRAIFADAAPDARSYLVEKGTNF